jgi:hypothetical protein
VGGRFPAAQAVFAAVFLVSCFGGIIVYNLTYSQPQGRFLFPVLSLVGVLFAVGVRELLRPVPRAAPALLACLTGAFVAIDVLSLLTVVQFYGRAGLFAWTAA